MKPGVRRPSRVCVRAVQSTITIFKILRVCIRHLQIKKGNICIFPTKISIGQTIWLPIFIFSYPSELLKGLALASVQNALLARVIYQFIALQKIHGKAKTLGSSTKHFPAS